jgi:hypothetical protein
LYTKLQYLDIIKKRKIKLFIGGRFSLKALRIIGWIFVPFVMIFVSWKRLRGVERTFGIIWTAISLFVGTANLANDDATKKTSVPVVTDQKQEQSIVKEDVLEAKKEESKSTPTTTVAPSESPTLPPTPTITPNPTIAPTPTQEPIVAPKKQQESSSVYYKNCTAAKAAGAAPIYEGEPGYRSALDRDHDGVACE